jgi:hypothetical protein
MPGRCSLKKAAAKPAELLLKTQDPESYRSSSHILEQKDCASSGKRLRRHFLALGTALAHARSLWSLFI